MERGPLSKDACMKNREFEPNAKVVGTLSEYVMSRIIGLAAFCFYRIRVESRVRSRVRSRAEFGVFR